MSGRPQVSAQTLKRVRDYVVDEPGFTLAFASWDMSRNGPPISTSAVRFAVQVLLDKGIVVEVERHGTGGKGGVVYAYSPPTAEPQRPRNGRRFAELDDARLAGIGVDAQPQGQIVPHTRVEGSSHKPGRDRKRQERGVRLARGKGK